MAYSTPDRRYRVPGYLPLISAAFFTFVPGALRAQHATTRPAPVASHAGPVRPGAAPVLARPVVQPPTRRGGAPGGWPVGAAHFSLARPVYLGASTSPRSESRQFSGAPRLRPFLFGGAFLGGFGGGSLWRSDELPLGFGTWPACDSAAVPGVFWSVGPCFGIGDYSAESGATAGSTYSPGTAAPATYLLPIFFAEAPVPGSSGQSGTATAPVPTALLYRIDGSTVVASDWWVAHGRLQYIADSGVAGSMDLSQLDLEQTIKQNQTRGLEFHLKFTAPADRP